MRGGEDCAERLPRKLRRERHSGDDTARRGRHDAAAEKNFPPKAVFAAGKEQSADTSHCGGTPARRGGDKTARRQRKTFRRRRYLRRERSKARTRVTSAARQQGAAGTSRRGGAPARRGKKTRAHEEKTPSKRDKLQTKAQKKTRNISDPFFAIRAACAETFGTGAPLRYFRFYAGFSSRPVGKPRRRSVRAPPLFRDFYSLPSGYSEKYSVGEPNLRFLTPL